MDQTATDLRTDIATSINKACAENGSNTPDFILAEFLTACLAAFDTAVISREMWYGRSDGAAFDYGKNASPSDRAPIAMPPAD